MNRWRTFYVLNACAEVAALVALSLFANIASAQSSGGIPSNPKFNSVDIGGNFTNVEGRLSLTETIQGTGTGTNIFAGPIRSTNALGFELSRTAGSYISFVDTSEYGLIGRADVASGGGLASTTGLGIFGGNGEKLTIGVSTGGFGFRALEFDATTGVPNFYADNLNLFGRTGTSPLFAISSTTRMSIQWVDTDNGTNVCQSLNGANFFFGVSSSQSDCNSMTPFLSVAQSGAGIDDVTLAAGTGGSDQLFLTGNEVNVSTNAGDINITASGGVLITSPTSTALDCTNAGCTSQTIALGSGSHAKLFAFSSGGIADVLGDTININDHSSGNAATVLINGQAPCLQDGTNCPNTGANKVAALRADGNGSNCTINSDVGINTCTRSSAGIFAVVFDTSYFSATPYCVATATSPSGATATFAHVFSESSSGVTVQVIDFNGTTFDGDFNLVCNGS